MFQVPNLPHDNLYKFLAFSGLALIITVNFFYYTVFQDFLARSSKMIVGQEKVLDRYNAKMRDLDRLESDVDRLVAKDTHLLSADEVKQLRDRLSEQQALSIELKGITHELWGEGQEVDYRSYQFDQLATLWPWANLLGLALMIIGSSLWYVRVQRPQDQVLAKQLREISARRPRLKA